jgi:hypothetical protein
LSDSLRRPPPLSFILYYTILYYSKIKYSIVLNGMERGIGREVVVRWGTRKVEDGKARFLVFVK